MTAPALRVDGLTKRFGAALVLDDVSLEVAAGEIHGLLGQNGSGKSTLVKCLAGLHAPDAGRAEAWGSPMAFPVRRARDHRIAFIHQDLGLPPGTTVVENIGVSTGYGSRALGRVGWAAARERSRELLGRIGVTLDPSAPVEALRPVERAAVAIARAIGEIGDGGRHLLVLDEPTAYLPDEEAERIVALMRTLATQGSAVVFISHRLGEVIRVCDRITVLRDGRRVTTVDARGASPRGLVELMLGRELASFYPAKPPAPAGDVVLRAEGVSGAGVFDASLTLRGGEVLGVTGLAGMGHDVLLHLLSGALPRAGGNVTVGGRTIDRPSPARMLEAGVVLVPADRPGQGVMATATAAENISLPVLSTHRRRGALRRSSELGSALDLMARFGVRPPAARAPVASFSGGNQQKIVLAKWLQAAPRVLLLDEPAQGVDAAAKHDILELVRDAVVAGAAVIYASADYEEVASMCHRVLIFRDGRIDAELRDQEVSESAILEACDSVGTAT